MPDTSKSNKAKSRMNLAIRMHSLLKLVQTGDTAFSYKEINGFSERRMNALEQYQESVLADVNNLKEIGKDSDEKIGKKLNKILKEFKKQPTNNTEELRFLLWQMNLQIDQYIEEYGADDEINAIKAQIEEGLENIAQAELGDDVFEFFIARYENFMATKSIIEDQDDLIRFSEEAKIPEKLDVLLEQQLQHFNNLEEHLLKAENHSFLWKQRYAASQHYDTIERGRELHEKFQEMKTVFLEKRASYSFQTLNNDELDDKYSKIQNVFNGLLKDYDEKKDKVYKNLKKEYQNILSKGSDEENNPEAWAIFQISITKTLRNLEEKTMMWLVEANNLYNPSSILEERIKTINQYKDNTSNLFEFGSIKTTLVENKTETKRLLVYLDNIELTTEILKEEIPENWDSLDRQTKETIIYDSSPSQWVQHLKQYGQEKFHKKKLKLVDCTLAEIKDFLLYIEKNKKKEQTEKLQTTLDSLYKLSGDRELTEKKMINSEFKKAIDLFDEEDTANIDDQSIQLIEILKNIVDIFNNLEQTEFQNSFIQEYNVGIDNGDLVACINALEVFVASIRDIDETGSIMLTAQLEILQKNLNKQQNLIDNFKVKHSRKLGKYLKIPQNLKEFVQKEQAKINERVYDLYSGRPQYNAELNLFRLNKINLYKQAKQKEQSQEWDAELENIIYEWEHLVMPLVIPDAKDTITLLKEQEPIIKGIKIKLQQKLAEGDTENYHSKEINKYFELIENIKEQLDIKEQLNMIVELDEHKLLTEMFLYYKSEMETAVATTYKGENIDFVAFTNKMGWKETIDETQKLLAEFINDPHNFELYRENWFDEKTKYLHKIIENHRNALNTEIQSLEEKATLSIDELKDKNALSTYWAIKEDEIRQSEIDAILESGIDQEAIKTALFKYRGVSGNAKSLTIDGLPGGIKEMIELVCVRALRLLELGATAKAKNMVRNIPGTFLPKEFNEAKRIFQDIETIFQGMGETSQTLNNLIDGTGNTLVDLGAAAELNSGDTRDGSEVYTLGNLLEGNWDDISLLKESDVKLSFDYNEDGVLEWQISNMEELEAKLSPEDIDAIKTAKAEIFNQAKIAEETGKISTIALAGALALQTGIDIKGIIDSFDEMHQMENEEDPDLKNQKRYANYVGLNIMAKASDWITKGSVIATGWNIAKASKAVSDSLSAEVIAKEASEYLNEKVSPVSILNGSLATAAAFFNLATQLTANQNPEERQQFWTNTTNSILDFASGLANAASMFDPVPSYVIGDCFAIVKDIKTIVEKANALEMAKQQAHFMKVLKQIADNDQSKYQFVLEQIQKDAKKARENAGFDLIMETVGLGLDSLQLAGNAMMLVGPEGGPLALLGVGVGIVAKILKGLKTGGVLAKTVIDEFANNKDHKELKKLLQEAREDKLDAILKIQSKSIQYAQAFLISMALEEAEEVEGGYILKDGVAKAYIESTGFNIDGKQAEEILESIGGVGFGMFTKRFKNYEQHHNTLWSDYTITSEGILDKLFPEKSSVQGFLNEDTDAVKTRFDDFINKMNESLKIGKDLLLFKKQHGIINYIDKRIGFEGILTNVTNQLNTLMQAAEASAKAAILKVTEAMNLLDLNEAEKFEQYKFLNIQRGRFENLLQRIPVKFLFK